MKCSHCHGASIGATSQEIVVLNFALKEHGMCLVGNGWEICLSPRVVTKGGEVIRDKSGVFKGTMWALD